jgi:putative ABC transport system ATP-binding protein
MPPPRHQPSRGLVEVRAVSKTFRDGDGTPVLAAREISLTIPPASIVAVVGRSGSGKSTLLHLIGALERPDSGSIVVDGLDITKLGPTAAADYRRRTGFVFQQFNLLPTLTALDNVTAPLMPVRTAFDKRVRARELLVAVGLADRAETLATRLSGGQQQRVAIARALVNQPLLILADEPTGNLDTNTGSGVLDLLFDIRDRHATTILLATHDLDIAARCDRSYTIRDGILHDK